MTCKISTLRINRIFILGKKIKPGIFYQGEKIYEVQITNEFSKFIYGKGIWGNEYKFLSSEVNRKI